MRTRDKPRRRPPWIAAAWPALALVAAGIAAPAAAAEAAGSADHLARGAELFQVHCATCHGRDGEGGSGPALALPTLRRVASDDELRKLIRNGVDGTDMPRTRLDAEQIAQVAAWVRSLGARPPEPLPGDPQRGHDVYFNQGGCAACHGIRGQGGALGPDLTDIGLRRGSAHLRASLLDPEAEAPTSHAGDGLEGLLPRQFLQVRVVTRDGRQILGVRLNEDTFTIQIQDLGNRIHSFFKDELAELHKDQGRSPMPAYGDLLSPQELDDLVAFLMRLRGE